MALCLFQVNPRSNLINAVSYQLILKVTGAAGADVAQTEMFGEVEPTPGLLQSRFFLNT